MGAKLSGLGTALYNPKRKEFLGRDGAGWGKLGVFYFFFYLGLAGFFCTMLAIFMALTPRDRPRYYLEESSMRTRSNPLSPGLGYRPQVDPDKNMIMINQNADGEGVNPNARSLDQYLQVYYWKTDNKPTKQDSAEDDDDHQEKPANLSKFVINNPGDCKSSSQYGYNKNKPCVLVKINKIVGFKPQPGVPADEKNTYNSSCNRKSNAIAIHCYGEYPADVDNIGPITYYSENGVDRKCGSIETKWFPYNGKYNRRDEYQAPYVWVQFSNPKPNILINVLCRAYAKNINFDKKTGRGLTRFQIYVNQPPPESARRAGDM